MTANERVPRVDVLSMGAFWKEAILLSTLSATLKVVALK